VSQQTDRVREYLRQRKLQNKDLGQKIHVIWSDPAAEMADLTIPDLEDVLELADRYENLCD
jgi:hypothetical protein